MSDEHPISEWIVQLHAGDERAAEQLFDVYFGQLMALARSRLLGKIPCRAEDEEDAAQSALKSYFRGAAAGRFDGVSNRNELWHLLAKITARKVVARYRRFHAQKRPQPLDEAALAAGGDDSGVFSLEHVLGREPPPELTAEFTDELRQRMQQLPNEEYRSLVWLKLDGFTNTEIALRMGTYERKIERRLAIIRFLWTNYDTVEPSPVE